MALLVDPPPHPTLPIEAHFPDNTQSPGQRIWLSEIDGIDLFGRNGNPPDSTLDAWFWETLNNNPTTDHWGTYAEPFLWFNWRGNAPSATSFEDPVLIAVELRTAAEVHTASGDPSSLAYTTWGTAPDLPPLDGKTSWGGTYSNYSPDPTIRVLVREDLATMGGPFSGRAFFIESLIHELGHATMMLLGALYSDDYVKNNLCDIFGRPTSDWNDLGLPWEHRVVEAAAESFKDLCFPHRRYKNRTALQLPFARFDDFKLLMFHRLESPYWDAGNIDSLQASEDQFFTNLGSTSIITNKHTSILWMVNPASFPNPANFLSFAGRRNLQWPIEGEVSLHYNFDPTGTDADPGAGNRWADIGMDGHPVYDFNQEAGFTGDPGNRVRWGLAVDFFDLDTNFVHTGAYYGTFTHPLWPPAGYVGDPRDYIPPVSGSIPVDFAAIEFATGITALPAEGFTMFARILAIQATQPKYTLYPFDTDTGGPQGRSFMWPWLEYSARRVEFPRPEPPWPYKTSQLTLGDVSMGRVVIPHRVRGRALRAR